MRDHQSSTCRQRGSRRPKRTMLAFNMEEFAIINKRCDGVTSTHRHDRWGLDHAANRFATAMETAYPLPLADSLRRSSSWRCSHWGSKRLQKL